MTSLLCVENLSTGYETPIVQNVAFHVDAGEMVGILGANGCGKTTLLRGVAGMIRRWSGTVSVCGEDDRDWSVRKRAGKIAYLSQTFPVLPGISVKTWIGMGDYAAVSPFARPNLKKIAQCAEYIGISSLLDQDYSRISAGQRQLVQLARIRMQAAAILLLDEPNSALDFTNTHRLFSMISAWNRSDGCGTVVVLHDPSLALQYCDRICLMDDGQIVAEICPRTMTVQDTERALRRLYPEICVEKRNNGKGYCCTVSFD